VDISSLHSYGHRESHPCVLLATPVIGPNLAKTKILAKYNAVNQVDRLPSGTKPAHAVREWEERERFSVT
jgi:hypothetical protein